MTAQGVLKLAQAAVRFVNASCILSTLSLMAICLLWAPRALFRLVPCVWPSRTDTRYLSLKYRLFAVSADALKVRIAPF